MPDNNVFEVAQLLTDYMERVTDDKIAFLQDNPTVKAKIVTDLGKLIEGHFSGSTQGERKWHEVHVLVEGLWQNLTSCALNSIDPNSKGNSKLFKYLKEATKFEDLLYGLEDYYRDHTLHSLWVYLIGDNLLSGKLGKIYEKPNWYLFNDLKKEKSVYDKKLLKFSDMTKEMVCHEVNKHKDAIWCIIALCHDLGYSLAKLDKLNERVQKVLEFFDVPDFRRVGYSLDIEHQYLASQFLELMAMEVRIVPGEDYDSVKQIGKDGSGKEDLKKFKECCAEWGKLKGAEGKTKESDYKGIKEIIEKIPRGFKDNLLIKCYRDDSTYWRLCRAMEKKEHGILSSYLIYKILGIFAESLVRGPAEDWGLSQIEAKKNIILGDILFAIAQHDFDFAHLNQLGSLADILVIADELEEFSRFGRQLQSRKYDETTAKTSISFKNSSGDIEVELGNIVKIEMTYDCQHNKRDDFIYFFYRKAKRLCSIYSLKFPDEQKEEEEAEKEDYCSITDIKMSVKWVTGQDCEAENNVDKKTATEDIAEPANDYWFCLSNEFNGAKAFLPECNEEGKKGERYDKDNDKYYEEDKKKNERELRCDDDEPQVIVKNKEGKEIDKVTLKKWLGIPDEKN